MLSSFAMRAMWTSARFLSFILPSLVVVAVSSAHQQQQQQQQHRRQLQPPFPGNGQGQPGDGGLPGLPGNGQGSGDGGQPGIPGGGQLPGGGQRPGGDRPGGMQQQERSGLMDFELVLGADLWSDKPEIMSAAPGFDGILGVDISSKEAVIAAGGTWNENINCTNEEDKVGAAVTASASNMTRMYDCLEEPNGHDGMPVCFSWPVVPSSIRREHFKYTRSDDVVIYPNCLSSYPNFEFNERHCVVLVDDFFNRILPAETEEEETGERLYMKSLEIVGDLMLVGPGGQLQSAKGLSRFAPWNESAYVTGPRFLAARLQPSDDLGEGVTSVIFRIFADETMPNSADELYGDQTNNRPTQLSPNGHSLYRIRLYTSGGMTPNGVTALKPDQFDMFFSISLSTGQTIDAAEEPVVVDGTGGGRITVLGLADLGLAEEDYDDCYPEDRDNYIDIVLYVLAGRDVDEEAVISTVQSVMAFHKGHYLYNPGGPGTDPAPGVVYTAPSPANQSVPVVVDLARTGLTTYCVDNSGTVSTIDEICEFWKNTNILIQGVPFSNQPNNTSNSTITMTPPTALPTTTTASPSTPVNATTETINPTATSTSIAAPPSTLSPTPAPTATATVEPTASSATTTNGDGGDDDASAGGTDTAHDSGVERIHSLPSSLLFCLILPGLLSHFR